MERTDTHCRPELLGSILTSTTPLTAAERASLFRSKRKAIKFDAVWPGMWRLVFPLYPAGAPGGVGSHNCTSAPCESSGASRRSRPLISERVLAFGYVAGAMGAALVAAWKFA